MAISREDLFRNALALDESDRTVLVGLLIDSLDPEAEQGVEAAWLREIDRRTRELDTGAVQTIPWEIARERLIARDEPAQMKTAMGFVSRQARHLPLGTYDRKFAQLHGAQAPA